MIVSLAVNIRWVNFKDMIMSRQSSFGGGAQMRIISFERQAGILIFDHDARITLKSLILYATVFQFSTA